MIGNPTTVSLGSLDINYAILNKKKQLHEFDLKADEGTFIWYSTTTKVYRVLTTNFSVQESVHVDEDASVESQTLFKFQTTKLLKD